MCGIGGWFINGSQPVEADLYLKGICSALSHRGPDGHGYKICGPAAFAHTRLSIIDLSSGQQPMASENGRIIVAFNGEIYNYLELTDDLKNRGADFKTRSDTEVLLKLYEVYGVDGFNYLRGMYAFSLWDAERRCGLLVRDPIGIKPLFYSERDRMLAFSSEAKGILSLPQFTAELDCQSLHYLMNFRYLPGGNTMFKDIRQVAPGVILSWRDGELRKLGKIVPAKGNENSIKEILVNSIKEHLVSDVPVGCYLSGGVDSSSILAMISKKKMLDYPIKTFTLNVGDNPREAEIAKDTANYFKVPNISSEVEIEQSFAKNIWALEVPKVNSLQVFGVASLASKHVKVALSGLGADEIFYGYNIHSLFYQAISLEHTIPNSIICKMGDVGQLICKASGAYWSEPQRFMACLQNIGNWPRIYGILRNVWDGYINREEIYGPRMLGSDYNDAFGYIEQHWPTFTNPLMAVSQYEWREKMVNDLLWQEDRCSMANGLEVRVPFLTTQLREAVSNLDLRELMPRGKKKRYLKNLMAAELPDSLLKKPKSGFQVNASKFMRQQLLPFTKQYLEPRVIKEKGIFNPTFVQRVFNENKLHSSRWHNFVLYLMIGTHMWVDLFENGDLARIR